MQVCDRRAVTRVGLQRGFGAFIAPLHGGLAALLPGLAPVAAGLAETRAMWDAADSDAEARLDRLAQALPGRPPAALAADVEPESRLGAGP